MLTLTRWVVPCAIATVSSRKPKKTQKLQCNTYECDHARQQSIRKTAHRRKEKKAQSERNGLIAVMRINIEMKITNNTIHIWIMNQTVFARFRIDSMAVEA